VDVIHEQIHKLGIDWKLLNLRGQAGIASQDIQPLGQFRSREPQ
jgi:type II secretory pathway component GspD/PulD (secretin)